ncbi:MAG: pro-sigmaK processing inhibitor BofA family protein [Megasphaera sp.]|jgi:inhibitor of the pro-sigma K processing machinery|nr:pro-sigmaK processing inhibitor BofA family protein [Megasphaera sp.]MCH4187493.1 pro-sigmaK processing inhibitor BofA family protein [Megasphaera sp.]MCH4217783.1 pro-sigmaK processing inhibitor BofA family protein [Megasphaera sp.]
MDYIWIGVGMIALFILNKFILAPIRSIVINLIAGFVVLYLINSYGYLLGLHIVPINWISGIIIGIFGLPGVAVLTVYYTFL